jgi:uncharacterized membrane protein affecting hemolysin expression
MLTLRPRTIRAKVNRLVVVTCAVVMVSALLIAARTTSNTSHTQHYDSIRLSTKIVGRHAKAAVVNGDAAVAQNILGALAVEPTILAAAVYLSDGTLLSSCSDGDLLVPELLASRSAAEGEANDSFWVTRPIGSPPIGWIHVVSDVRPLRAALRWQMLRSIVLMIL